jgi:endonuclease/exonuclease/phosphatase family metal-dependent hydrolase
LLLAILSSGACARDDESLVAAPDTVTVGGAGGEPAVSSTGGTSMGGSGCEDPQTPATSAKPSTSDRVIIWQQNVEGMKAGQVGPKPMTDAMLVHTYQPDIVLFQEAWQKTMCGSYLDPAAIAGDADANNWKESLTDDNGLARTCRLGRDPLPGSVLHRLGEVMWGSVENVGQRRPFSDTLGQHTATGTLIAWDASRFVLEDDFVFDDSDIAGCDDVLKAYKRIAVLLRDTRRTCVLDDDVLIGLSSVHYGSACRSANNKYVAEQMIERWASFGGRQLGLRVLAGDMNLRVDETSSTYSARRRETTPEPWYQAVTANTSWTGGQLLDAVKTMHGGGSGDTAEICAQWSYPNVQSCIQKTLCSATCSGWGIGGQLDRLDYVFVSNDSGTLPPSRIIAATSENNSAAYSDHKAVRVSISLD